MHSQHPESKITAAKAESNWILLVGLGLESALAICFFVWAWFRGFNQPLLPKASDLCWGLLLTLPLAAANLLIFEILSSRLPALSSCRSFVEKIL